MDGLCLYYIGSKCIEGLARPAMRTSPLRAVGGGNFINNLKPCPHTLSLADLKPDLCFVN